MFRSLSILTRLPHRVCILISLPLVLVSHSAHCTESLDTTSYLSLFHNPAIVMAPEKTEYQIGFYEVPTSWVTQYVDPRAEPWLQLFANPNTPEVFRFPIHPFDSHTPKAIERSLMANGLEVRKGTLSEPWRITESRSLFPTSSAPFSLRLSMTDGFGPWSGEEVTDFGVDMNKLIPGREADFAFQAAQLARKKLNGYSGQYFELLPDLLTFSLRLPGELATVGATLRDISALKREETIMIPGFATLENEASLILALLNGYEDEMSFLLEKEARIRGRGWAELVTATGFVHSSPHSQNVLFEADSLMRLTGKLMIRDLSDLVPTLFEMQADPEYRQLFDRHKSDREALTMDLEGTETHFPFRSSVGQGNSSHKSVVHVGLKKGQLDSEVEKSFLRSLSTFSKVPLEEIEEITIKVASPGYPILYLDVQTPVWEEVLQGMFEYRQNLSLQEETINQPSYNEQDRMVLSLLEKSEKSELPTNIEISDELIRALLINKLQNGSEPDPDLLDRLTNHYTPDKIKSSVSTTWISSALLALEALNPDLIPEVFFQLTSDVARDMAILQLVHRGSIEANIEFLKQTDRNSVDKAKVLASIAEQLGKNESASLELKQSFQYVDELAARLPKVSDLLSLSRVHGLALSKETLQRMKDSPYFKETLSSRYRPRGLGKVFNCKEALW